MEDELKEEIVRLKEEGLSYSAISKRLKVNLSTVKSVCRRDKKPSCCLYCGKPLKQTRGHRQKKFCSSKCKDSFHNKRRKRNE